MKEDDESKALFIDRSLIFAYTGLARMEGQESILWLAEVLKPFVDENALHEGTFEVARRASAFFVKQRLPAERKLHTFVGAGWMRSRRNNSIVPVAVRITNAYDDSFQPLACARDTFAVHRICLRRLSGVSLLFDGARVESSASGLCRTLRRSYFLNSPLNSARLLAREVRNIADALGDKGPVGRNLTVTCLPRDATSNTLPPVLGPPTDDSPSSFYVPATGTGQIRRSPAIIQAGFPVILSDVSFEIPPPADGSDPYLGWR